MKMFLRKLTALVMLTALVLPMVQVNIVYASTQPPITDLKWREQRTSSGTESVTLEWSKINATPNSTDNPDPSVRPAGYNENYIELGLGAQGYDITYQNMTRNTAAVTVTDPPVPPNTSYTVASKATVPGSIYSFKVTPYHMHPQRLVSQTGDVYYEYVPGIKNPSTGGVSEAILLTDIQVEAEGENDSLTITWDDPKYGGTTVFDNFNIYIVRSPSTNTRSGAKNGGIVRNVSRSDCTAIAANPLLDRGPKLQYTIKDSGKIYSGKYDVAIEPCDTAGRDIREDRVTTSISVTGRGYLSLTYSKYNEKLYEKKEANVKLGLYTEELGSEQVVLKWGDLSSFGDVAKISIFSNTSRATLEAVLDEYSAKGTPTPPVTLTNKYATSYPLVKPSSTTYYGIVVEFVTGSPMKSEVAAYVPSSVKVTPATPDIHEPITGKEDNSSVDLYWDAFLKETSSTENYISELRIGSSTFWYYNDIVYDLLIVDDIDLLEVSGLNTLTVSDGPPGRAEAHAKTENGMIVPAYFAKEVTSYTNASGVNRPFEKNKLYYVRLTAKRRYTSTSGAAEYLVSEPAYTTVYIPVSGDISSPSMIRKPPLSILEDEEGNEVVTSTSIGITWIERWSEVFDKSTMYKDDDTVLAEWQTKVAVDTNDDLYYGDDAKGRNNQLVDFCSILDLAQVRSLLGLGDEIPARTLNVENCSYEVKVLTYQAFIQAVEAAGSYEKYLETLMAERPTNGGWRRITPKRDDMGNPSTIISGLTQNTTYAILLRAYRGTSNYGYASFIAASTMPTVPPLIITPTPPVLEVVSTTDTTAVLKWKNASTIDYEGVYSDVYFTDIDNQYTEGLSISYKELMEKSTLKTENNIEYRYFTLEGLLPDTEYHFWGQARSQSNRYSGWSNPAYFKTKEIVAPSPPRGFGIASANDVGLINKKDSTNFTPRNKNYLIMQWMKDAKDPKTDGTGTGTAVADVLSHPDIVSSYIAKFNGLISNKTYYFRAKTILTIAMGEDLRTAASYAYRVQISLEPDFLEHTEIYVPANQTPADGVTYRQAESEWTKTIYYRTSTSGDDYDTDFDPDLVPLPDENFEVTYDGPSGTLTYRFRTSEKDAKGNYDNRVDQRFITELVNKQVHNYEIDVTKYNNYKILRRVVEVPYTLLKTFDERKISFGIKTGDVTVTLPPGTMETALVKSLPDYGDKAKLQVIITEKPSNMPMLAIGETYAMTPQAAALYVQTPTQYVKMPVAGVPLDVKLSLANRFDLMDMNVLSYVKTEQTEGWSAVPSKYEKETGQMSFKSQPGIYAAIAKSAPQTVNFDQSTTSMLNVQSSFAITDMSVYNGNLPANSNQLLNVMDAIAKGSKSLSINKTPDAAAVSTLHRSGTNIQPGAATVSREQAIASMVRLYEIKSGRQIKPTYTLDTTPYTDTRNVQQAYQYAMLKAAEIDMLNGKTAIRPKDSLTLGELFELADVIIADNGL